MIDLFRTQLVNFEKGFKRINSVLVAIDIAKCTL
jgi:hypothetical protein